MVSKTDSEDVVLIDWQFFGTGRAARDVAYFLILSMDCDYDRDVAFIKAWHNELLNHLPNGCTYEWETAFRDVMVAIVEWNTKIMSAMAGPFITPKTLDALLLMPKVGELVRGALFCYERMLERLVWIHERHGSEMFLSPHDGSVSRAPEAAFV